MAGKSCIIEPVSGLASFRTISDDPSELLLPAIFRVANYSECRYIMTVSTYLRPAWSVVPPEGEFADEDARFGAGIRAWHRLSPEGKLAFIAETVGPDKEDVDSPWRSLVYRFWNHVFSDVSNSLNIIHSDVAHFHAPNHEALPLHYLEDGAVGVARGKTVMKWDVAVLLACAHLERDVEVRLSHVVDGVEETLGTFTNEERYEKHAVWYLKEETEVTFHVEGGFERNAEGVAAVLVVGKMCMKDQKKTIEPDEDGEDEPEAEIPPGVRLDMLHRQRQRQREQANTTASAHTSSFHIQDLDL